MSGKWSRAKAPGLRPREPSWPRLVFSLAPEGTPQGDTVSKQAGVSQANKIIVSASSIRTGQLEKASVRFHNWNVIATENLQLTLKILILNSSENKELNELNFQLICYEHN